MKAVILVGGFGTRLRPYTFTKPKPLVPFVNMPILEHQIEALVRVGLTDLILSVCYMSDQLLKFKEYAAEKYKIKVHFFIEDYPLGTAGPLAIARELLEQDEFFFMLNSDVGCEFPFAEMIEFHKGHNHEGTIFVTPVEDPSKYGLVVFNEEDGKVSAFLEKPEAPSKEYPSKYINAGLYLLNKSVLDYVPLPDPDYHSVSIEREVFPKMVIKHDLHAMILDGYWMDIGQPKDFIKGTRLHLDYLHKRGDVAFATGFGKNVLIDPSATVHPSASLGPNVVIGPKCKIGEHAHISNSTIMEGTIVEHAAFISDSIVGWKSKIRSHAKVEKSYLGADTDIAKGIFVSETSVCPHKGVKTHNFSGILM